MRKSPSIYKSLGHRLDANSVILDNSESPCWIWIGAKNKAGYGRFNRREGGKVKCLYAHRVAFELYRRELLEDEEIDHLCYTRSCINPEHLQAVSKMVNLDNRRY